LNAHAFRWGVAESETMNGAEVTRLEYANGHAPGYFQFDRYCTSTTPSTRGAAARSSKSTSPAPGRTRCCMSPAGSRTSSGKPAPRSSSSA